MTDGIPATVAAGRAHRRRDHDTRRSGHLYYVCCPTHDAKVLLFHDRARGTVNSEYGIAVHLECYDGTALVWEVEREGRAQSTARATRSAQPPDSPSPPTDVQAVPACCLVGG